MKYLSSTIALLLFYSFNLFAQDEWPVKKEQDGVTITYQFSDLKGKRAEEGPKELCVVVRNNNDYPVKVSFTIAFFADGLGDEESAPIKLCIPPGKELKGKKNGLCWLITEENNTKINEDAFDWDVNDLEVKKTTGCN